jgi:hypothetical protein
MLVERKPCHSRENGNDKKNKKTPQGVFYFYYLFVGFFRTTLRLIKASES